MNINGFWATIIITIIVCIYANMTSLNFERDHYAFKPTSGNCIVSLRLWIC